MIKRIEITGIHNDIEKDVNKYVQKKIGKLDGYMPRHARKSAHAEVKLKESSAEKKKQSTCEVTIFVPNAQITASETTINMFAAIDIVEEKLKSQLRKYKDQNNVKKTHGDAKIRRMFGKVVGKKS